ncbi:LysR substrate-binding domain-containing protein [Psychromonas sp. 14N.309.X.WAT.B.A12]|uniref:LysR substrate-binding domain-containing protein n=1 Tax=unclassified Psychromonas TaxID=2614957 RepID=UPI0025AFD305|nr:LysR substrate-binding domain-containing protein [Psychromonas sp. 14N.309.X.WAT.B.A12]MDN2663863.1 LysR substrate-binding domain-containing protein [Psychromonas sp. 14N.309.X.WAT.B.A12]
MSIRLPSTTEMQAFIVTADHLKFTLAAQRLNVTQGAVSRQIISLEKKLDIQLFHRHARGLSLTEKGEQFLPLVKQVINQMKSAVAEVSSVNPVVRLKAPSCISNWLLPKIMAFQQTFPDITVELTSSIKHDINFSSEAFDAAICYCEQVSDKSLTSQCLFEEVLTPVCAPSLLPEGIAELSIEEMRKFPWLHSTPQQHDWKQWLALAGSDNLPVKHQQHFATLDLAVSAAKQGFGISIGDVVLASSDVQSGQLIMPHAVQLRSGKSYYLVYPQKSNHLPLQTLLTWLA